MEPITVETAERAEFPPYGTYAADCPARAALDLFAHTWLPVVAFTLRDGPMRPSQLRAEIGGISQKMLTQTLRQMEQRGLVRRQRFAEAPPRVTYELTQPGTELLIPILALGQWASRHYDTALAAPCETQDAGPSG